MNFLKKSITTLALVGSVASANAAIYYSAEVSGPGGQGSPLALLDSDTNATYSGTLTDLFTGPGFDWTKTEIVKAVIMFGFSEDNVGDAMAEDVSATASTEALELEVSPGYLQAEEHDLDVDIENDVALEVEVNGEHSGDDDSDGYIDDFDYREAELGTKAIDDITKNGSLGFEVTAEDGSTYLKTVQIKIETQDKPPSKVPDSGATLALFSVGLAGLVLARRKRS